MKKSRFSSENRDYLHGVFQAEKPVGGDAVEFAERDDVPDGDLILSCFISTVLLLLHIQHFSNIHLAISLFCTDYSQSFTNVHNDPSK